MYRTVKLNIFFGRFDWHAEQILVSWESENFVILVKKSLDRLIEYAVYPLGQSESP
jgi:hypothetical protein